MKLLAQTSDSGSLNEIASIGSARRIGMLLFVLVFGVFGIWAAVAPLDGNALAPGRVTARSFNKIVQHLEGGIVKQLFVKEGDEVKVKVIGFDRGKVKLSMKQAAE